MNALGRWMRAHRRHAVDEIIEERHARKPVTTGLANHAESSPEGGIASWRVDRVLGLVDQGKRALNQPEHGAVKTPPFQIH